MRVIYPGSFDPVTLGHLYIIERCSEKFDEVVVGVLDNIRKDNLFSVEERKKLLEDATIKLPNVEIDSFSGLLVDYAKKQESTMIIRGLRAVSDLEYEMQMAIMNKSLYEDLDTIFLISDGKYSFLSSSIVREISRFGGDISKLVPSNVCREIEKKFEGMG